MAIKQPDSINTVDDMLLDVIVRIERIEKTLKIFKEDKLAVSKARDYLRGKNKI